MTDLLLIHDYIANWTLLNLKLHFQIKSSLAKAFSRKKNSAGKADSTSTADSDSISILSDISVADSAADYFLTPTVRTADWFVLSVLLNYGKRRCIQVFHRSALTPTSC